MWQKKHAKRRKVVTHCHSRVFVIFFWARRKEKAINKLLNKFAKEELVNILRRLYLNACSHDGKYYSRNIIQWGQFELAWIGIQIKKTYTSILCFDRKVNLQMMLSMLTWSSSLAGKISSTKQKPALIPGDVELLYENKQFWPGNTRKLTTSLPLRRWLRLMPG